MAKYFSFHGKIMAVDVLQSTQTVGLILEFISFSAGIIFGDGSGKEVGK